MKIIVDISSDDSDMQDELSSSITPTTDLGKRLCMEIEGAILVWFSWLIGRVSTQKVNVSVEMEMETE